MHGKFRYIVHELAKGLSAIRRSSVGWITIFAAIVFNVLLQDANGPASLFRELVVVSNVELIEGTYDR